MAVDKTDDNTKEPKALHQSPKEEQAEGRRDLARALGLCLIAVILVRSFVVEPFKIPSSSMVPTLRIGDRIFVTKFNFSLKIPFTQVPIVDWGTPNRGDVVVFVFPKDESLNYIKRVVGLPGDVVEFRGRDTIVNGKVMEKRQVTDPAIIAQVTGDDKFEHDLFIEKFDDEGHYVQYHKIVVSQFTRNRPPEEVPEGHYFVVGDNRDSSYDSRSWGMVPHKNLAGKAQLVWMSLEPTDKAEGYLKVRWDRFGTLIR